MVKNVGPFLAGIIVFLEIFLADMVNIQKTMENDHV